MRLSYPLIIILLLSMHLLPAQGPAGSSFYVDYQQFTQDNQRRYLHCGNDASLNPGTELTMEAWINVHDPNWDQKILGKMNPNFNSGYTLGVIQGRCYPAVWTPTAVLVTEGFIPPLGFWYHLAATAIPGDSCRAYVNGEYVGGLPLPGTAISPNNDPLIIGIAAWDLVNFQYFGYIDEMRIWDVARTTEEIVETMHVGLTGNEPGLISYHTFDNATVNSLILDESPNSNDCTAFNCDPSNLVDSRAVMGDATMATMDDIHGLWNGNGFTNPRFALTDNGISLVDTLSNTDYAVFGHDSGTGVTTADLPAGAPASMERTGRVWYFNEVGTTTPNFSCNLSYAAGGGTTLNTTLTASQYYLLHRSGSTGTFTPVGSADVKNGSVVIFNNVNLEDGFYTLGATPDPFVGIGSGLPSKTMSVYPNPGTGRFKMVIETQLSELAQLQIFDVMGKKVHDQAFDGDISYSPQELDLSQLTPGSYFLHVRSGDRVFVKEVMVIGKN